MQYTKYDFSKKSIVRTLYISPRFAFIRRNSVQTVVLNYTFLNVKQKKIKNIKQNVEENIRI